MEPSIIHCYVSGAIFAVIASMETLMNILGFVSGSQIYSATVGYYRGFIFFIMAGVNIVCLILIG